MAVIRKLEKPQETNTLYIIDKKKTNEEHSDANWIISYADMMTLLCIFFIMLFSMSKLNVPEFESAKKEVAEHFGTKYESPTEDLGKFINMVLVEAGVQKQVTMTSDGTAVAIAFHSTMFFDTLSAEISPAGQDIVDKIASKLAEFQQKKNKQYKIVVEGHTDDQPILGGPFPTNWELSSARASRVVRMFINKGFDPKVMLPIGLADTQPVEASTRNPDGSWNQESLAKNRRVVMKILLPETDSIPFGKQDKGPYSKPAVQAENTGK
jgi:chemotaxis protein MotB